MIQNRTKQRLSAGQLALGCFVRSPDPTLAEYVASGGWDFLVFDGEHGTVSLEDVPNLVRACDVRGVTSFVRVPTREPGVVLRCLDAGAGGIIYPWVSDSDQARSAVRFAKYAPLGNRGLAGNRSIDWSTNRETIGRANDSTMVVVQVETSEAVDNVEDLCRVDGVDVLFIGPSDLSQSLGVPGEIDHPLVREAVAHVAAAVRRSDKHLGLFAGTTEAAAKGVEHGARFVATSVEMLLGGGMASFVGALSP